METIYQLSLTVAGVFAVILGVLHFFFPYLLDFKTAIPADGTQLKPFRLLILRYQTLRQDVRGIAWVMNHCVSYVIVSIGIADLVLSSWFITEGGRMLALWIAGFYFVRALSQLYLGRRRGDWLILFGFSTLGLIHAFSILL